MTGAAGGSACCPGNGKPGTAGRAHVAQEVTAGAAGRARVSLSNSFIPQVIGVLVFIHVSLWEQVPELNWCRTDMRRAQTPGGLEPQRLINSNGNAWERHARNGPPTHQQQRRAGLQKNLEDMLKGHGKEHVARRHRGPTPIIACIYIYMWSN